MVLSYSSLFFFAPMRGDAEILAMEFYRKPSVCKVGEVVHGRDVIHTRGSLPVSKGVQRRPAWGAASLATDRSGE